MDAGDRDYNDLFLVNQHRFLAMPAEATNRAGARTDTEPSQPFDYTLPKDEIFAVALEGYEDENDECYRMKITVPKDRGPDWGKTDRLHQEPEKWNVRHPSSTSQVRHCQCGTSVQVRDRAGPSVISRTKQWCISEQRSPKACSLGPPPPPVV